MDAVFETLAAALAGGQDVPIGGFGTFGTRDRPACAGSNPHTGELVSIPASTLPVFRPGETLRDASFERIERRQGVDARPSLRLPARRQN